MVNEAGRGRSKPDGLLQRASVSSRDNVSRKRPADDAAAEQVDEHREIPPTSMFIATTRRGDEHGQTAGDKPGRLVGRTLSLTVVTGPSAELSAAIDTLYETFASYRVADLSSIGIFDFGPTDEELRRISVPLGEISVDAVRSMEFYAEDWNSWGSEADVKYVLPRVLECLVSHLDLLASPGTMSLFKYKLRRGLTPHGKGLLSYEQRPVEHFMAHLLSHHVTQPGLPEYGALGYLVEALVELRFDVTKAHALFAEHPSHQSDVAEALLRHFNIDNGSGTPQGVYCQHKAGLRSYTDWAVTQHR